MNTAIDALVDREDDGFTLIELMVVVLIIAILLAIAIPTFLGARNSANARAAQSNLRNALTAEQTEWTDTQGFSSSTTVMAGIESGINWTTATAATTPPNQVSVLTGDSGNMVLLQAQGKDANCYYILQSNDPTDSFTGYAEDSGTCETVTVLPTVTSPTPGSASSHVGVPGDTSYYTSF